MIEGKLLKRAKLNLSRLLDPLYDYPNSYKYSVDWPGDFPGRILLALTSLYQTFNGYDKERKMIKERLRHILSHIESKLNNDKFFGPEFNPDYINEQQLSGNGWYLRGLCKYYDIFKDEKAIEALNIINNKLLIPLSFYYKDYPIEERNADGGVCGHSLENTAHNWLLSSDVGCAFILLDGYVSCYEIIKNEDLKKAIEFIIEQFEKIDYVALKCQTHATMTCARAILRFYQITKNDKYLDLAKSIFNKYVKYGMTDDYQNINWFQREDSWTEPCCVVDSFILAKQLYLITHEVKYLKLFNRIYLNGLRTFQRINGGAGCSSVVKDNQRILKQWMFEAWFCCTMRTSEGFNELSNALIKKDNQYILLIPQSFRNKDIDVNIDLYEDRIFDIVFKKPGAISIYVPDGFESDYQVKNNMISIASNEAKKVSIKFEININKVNKIYLIGDMVLSQKDKHLCQVYNINGHEYSLINDSTLIDEESLKDIQQEL